MCNHRGLAHLVEGTFSTVLCIRKQINLVSYHGFVCLFIEPWFSSRRENVGNVLLMIPPLLNCLLMLHFNDIFLQFLCFPVLFHVNDEISLLDQWIWIGNSPHVWHLLKFLNDSILCNVFESHRLKDDLLEDPVLSQELNLYRSRVLLFVQVDWAHRVNVLVIDSVDRKWRLFDQLVPKFDSLNFRLIYDSSFKKRLMERLLDLIQ